MTGIIEQIEQALRAALTGSPVEIATDADGPYISPESAATLAELVSTDLAESLGLTEEHDFLEDGWGRNVVCSRSGGCKSVGKAATRIHRYVTDWVCDD